MEEKYFNKVFEIAIWDRGEAAVKNLDGIQTSWVVLESIGQILRLMILSRDLTSTGEEVVEIPMKFG